MTWCRCNLALIVGFVVLTIASGDSSVHVLTTYRQLITSNTLNWRPVAHYADEASPIHHDFVIGGFQKTTQSNDASKDNDSRVPQEERPIFVCRALHSGVWVAGRQIKGEKRCTVTLSGNVKSYERYDLLENVESAARLSWMDWDKFHSIHLGTVATHNIEEYVARYKVPSAEDNRNGTLSSSYTHYIGTLDRNKKLGTITFVKDDGTEGSTDTSGEVLVETEPVFYELTSVNFHHWRKKVIKNEPKIIGEATFKNSRSGRDKLAQAFGYEYKYLSYWGQGHAMIKALNTSITLVNGTRLPDIRWGMDENSDRESIYNVEIYLEPGTAVNVTLRANYTDIEVPYTGQLVSRYADGETKSREINGLRKEMTMMDIKPEFTIYFLSNNSIVPTTLPPPTTQGTTGTVSKSTMSSSSGSTSTSTATKSSDILSKDEEDENMIIPPRKSDTSNMQSDDGGPLSLKNKEDDDRSSSNIFKLSVAMLLTSLGMSLYRIT